MDIANSRRSSGVYIIRTVGMQGWDEGGRTVKAHGVRLELMDGPSLLAVCKLEVPGTEPAEERGVAEAERIAPWVTTLRRLEKARSLRARLRYVQSLIEQTEGDGPHMPMLDHLKDELLAYAQQGEVEQANASNALDSLGLPLARLVAARLQREVNSAFMLALAVAPDVTASPIHPAWERPIAGGLPGAALAQETARDLLAGWTAARDLRDPLVTWSVEEAGITRTDVQAVTGISRSTINRLLP